MTDKEKLIELLNGFSTPVTLNGEKLMDWNIPMPGLRKAIADHLLANGVTVPVRCKDCKFWECGTCKLHSEEPDQYSVGLSVVMMGTDFCSYGERKDND